MKTENLKIINEMFLNKGLVMFDKEIQVFFKNDTTKGKKTPERKLQLVWDKMWVTIKK